MVRPKLVGGRPYIVGFGIACMDYIVVGPTAAPGTRVDADDFCIQGGGLTGTAIVAAARLGAATTLLGRLGDDEAGREVVRDLNAEGVDTSNLILVPGAKSLVSVILVDSETAERTIYSRLDIGIDCPTQGIDLARVRKADAVVLDPHWKDGAMLVASEANAAGVPVVCDVNNPVRHRDLLALCDYPIVSRDSALRLVDKGIATDALSVLASISRRGAVVTCGADGAYYAEGGERGHVPAFEVDAVDTTGAGDTFHGAFAVALTQGWGIRDCTTFASAVSAIKCTRLGGRAGIPSFDQTLSFLAQRGQHLPPLRY
jgi:sulfofructose kinase